MFDRFIKRTGCVLGIVAAIALLYVLSCGPLFAVRTNGYISWKAYATIYAPVLWLASECGGTVLDLFNCYVNEWDSWFGPD